VSRQTASRIAWAVCAISIALTFAALAFLILNRSTPSPAATAFGTRLGDATLGIALLTFPPIGALVASRRPDNPIGWIILGVGLLFSLAGFANQYGIYALLTEPGSLPAGVTMAWLGSWLFLAPLILTGTLLFLLFPNGRLLSRRWRPVLWIAVLALVLALPGEALGPHEHGDGVTRRSEKGPEIAADRPRPDDEYVQLGTPSKSSWPLTFMNRVAPEVLVIGASKSPGGR